jgi:hypothetical protein
MARKIRTLTPRAADGSRGTTYPATTVEYPVSGDHSTDSRKHLPRRAPVSVWTLPGVAA